MEIIKDFVNDPDVIKFKRNDQSKLIDVRNHNKKVGENKGIAKKFKHLVNLITMKQSQKH